jgi:hypothetical protein
MAQDSIAPIKEESKQTGMIYLSFFILVVEKYTATT